MYSKLFAAAGIVGVFLLAPAAADASCCDQAKYQMTVAPMDIDVLSMLPIDTDTQLFPAPPVRQMTEVWFQRPAMVGRHILQGRYVIEHDNDRMARGEPCTHIYAYNDRTKPVVAFHCTHLERDRYAANTVVLASIGDGTMQELQEFQFAGEHAAHGVPSGR